MPTTTHFSRKIRLTQRQYCTAHSHTYNHSHRHTHDYEHGHDLSSPVVKSTRLYRRQQNKEAATSNDAATQATTAYGAYTLTINSNSNSDSASDVTVLAWAESRVFSPHQLYANFICYLLSFVFIVLMICRTTEAYADTALQDLLALDSAATSVLTDEDIAVLKELAQSKTRGKQKSLVSKPYISKPGEVRFIFGASQPTVVCSLLHVCDIALEPGESVVDLKVGDSARWVVERSASGSPAGIIEHITLKPTDVGLVSNLRIYTDRRSYYIDLKSSATEFMPQVAFSYPEQSLERFAQVKERLQQSAAMNTVAMPQDPTSTNNPQRNLIADLDFAYETSGDEELFPLRVFNDGRKTYVQMPPALMQGRLPALVVVNAEHTFGSDDMALTNYRIQDNCFIVDGTPPHLRLILGDGDAARAQSADLTHIKS